MWNNWSLQCYLIRHFNISVDDRATNHTFYLIDKTIDNKLKEKYERVEITTKQYNLYKLIKDKNIKSTAANKGYTQ